MLGERDVHKKEKGQRKEMYELSVGLGACHSYPAGADFCARGVDTDSAAALPISPSPRIRLLYCMLTVVFP
jgi:hypothetical protein